MKFLKISAISAALFCSGPALASDDDVLTIAFRWNPVQAPWDFREVLHHCVENDKWCSGAVDAAGQLVGIPAGAVRESMRTADRLGLGVKHKPSGEQHYMILGTPNRYRPCDLSVMMTSVAPLEGNKTPTFQAAVHAADGREVTEFYSFVHKLGLGQGNSWVDANIALKLVKIGTAAERRCYMESGKKYVYRCKGPQCGTIELGHMPPK